jgi:CelD/BcsL family acetyltransferase involved in cellulose biosynthesis
METHEKGNPVMKGKIKPLKSSDRSLWNHFVSRKIGIHFYSWEWNEAVACFHHLDFIPLALCDSNHEPLDLFPLLIDYHSNRLYSGEFGGMGGCTVQENFDLFIRYILDHYECSILSVISPNAPLSKNGTLTVINHEMKTSIRDYENFDTFFEQLPRSLKKNYRKAVRNDIRAEKRSDIETFYSFYKMAMARNRAKEVLPFDWFAKLHAGLKDTCILYTAYCSERPIGSLFSLIGNEELYNYFTVTDPEYKTFQPGALLFLELFKLAFKLKSRYVNLGPAVLDTSHYIYKKKIQLSPIPPL